MKRFVLLCVLCVVAVGIYGQWSSNTQAPTLIAGGTGAQVMPKVALGVQGETYISRFDNSSGSYKVWLNLLNFDGEPLWTNPQGVEMNGSISDTWLTDYDLTTDQAGNALVCFQDIRAGINSIYIYKVSRAGQQLWGENGLCLSVNAGTENPDYTPKVLNTADDNTYVAWQHQSSPSQIMLQKINIAGQIEWANPLSISVDAASCTWPQFLESVDNGVLMKYYVDSGPFWAPTRHIKVARVNPAGNLDWDQSISTAGAITAWTQIIGFASDGAGGASLSWHDDRDMNNMTQAFFAHITAAGVVTTPENGAYVSSDVFYQQYYPMVVCDFEAQEARVVMRITDANQNQCGVIMQVFDYSGNRQLGDTGRLLHPLSEFDYNPQYAWNYEGKFYYFYQLMNITNPQVQNFGCMFNTDLGWYNSWQGAPISYTQTSKMHQDFTAASGGWVITCWEDGASDGDIYAMKYYYNGNVGAFNGAPENVTAEFVSPHSIHVTWSPPQYSQPLSYIIQINSDIVEVLPTPTEYTFLDMLPGTYNISIRAVYTGQELSPPSETFTIFVVSNEDLVVPALSLSVAPNPFRNATEIRWQNRKFSTSTLSLYNLRGQKVHSAFLPAASGEQSYQLNGANLPSGIYFLRLATDTGVSCKRLVLMP
ncbi:MAG: hypothetical protein CVU48_05880 [Candidatus Cloacimonetes bacterium HGW-Cloacimonetes-1]|jgi:hypothetical protein|nr:MAG: hypothetical protein CVU48_05880 [Candidatus Cloacimonetes bacterium HGW-Cloacimonetes-1]